LAEEGTTTTTTTTKAHDQRRLLGTRKAKPIQFQSALGMRPGALSLLPLPASRSGSLAEAPGVRDELVQFGE